MDPNFCYELKLGPDNSELPIEGLKLSTFSGYQAASNNVSYKDNRQVGGKYLEMTLDEKKMYML